MRLKSALLAALSLAFLSACAGPRVRGEGRGIAVAEWARRELGRPYRHGGRAPASGFDCSGLAWWTHHQAGIDIPPTSETQFRAGRQVGRSALRAGDLVFFTTERRGPSHVGVYIGEGLFIHSPKAGRDVSEDRLEQRYWKKRFLGARRYW
ncbi:MAG: C40 family peptidase [Elusimicrobia bacterium]|nr:C40 family peptidase [Elusimicrobiota bacterium]